MTQDFGDQYPTRRETSPALEEILYEAIPILDHGFIRVIDYMGTDSSIVQAARVSYGKGTKKVQEDRGLIRYLMRHRHSTPFEMCEIKFHIKLPIFVARQWIRHRTANVNEYSARYSILDREFYIPSPESLAEQSLTNRQGRESTIGETWSQDMIDLLKKNSDQLYTDYEYLLNDANHPSHDAERPGLARELARMGLSLNYYTQWYWKIDLHNLMHFLSLRADSHAQYEIRVYADTMIDILKRWLPLTYEAFCDYRFGSVSLSKKSLEIVQRWIKGEEVSQEDSGLTPREWRELCEVWNKG
jgi:thymidylate synthase (FAD)